MDDVVTLTIAVTIALVLIIHGAIELFVESGLVGRLVPVEARLLDPGVKLITEPTPPPNTTTVGQTDIAGNPISDSYYYASWEYSVAGQRHEGKLRRGNPIFTAEQAKSKRVTVYYDPLKPSVSRVDMLPAKKGKYMIGTGIAIIVASLIIVMFVNIGSFTAEQPAQRRF